MEIQERPPDFDGASTTIFIQVLRRKLTPKVLWGIIVALVTALLFVSGWLATTRYSIVELNLRTDNSAQQVADMRKQVAELREELDTLHNIETKLAVMANDIAAIKAEVALQRSQWDFVHKVAREPTHQRRNR